MFWWIIQNSVIAGLMAGLVGIACRLFRIDPVVRHALWVIVLIKLVTPPLVVWPSMMRDPLPGIGRSIAASWDEASRGKADAQKTTIVSETNSALHQTQPIQSGGKTVTSDAYESDEEIAPDKNIAVSNIVSPPKLVVVSMAPTAAASVWRLWPAFVGGAWLIGTLAFVSVQCIRIGRMIRLVRKARPADASLQHLADEMAGRLGMRSISMLAVPGIATPAIWAFARATMLWPEGLGVDRCESAVAGLVVHELAHVRRRDHWVGWLELIAGCAWWWNPLYWYVRHQVRENAELACDAWVVDVLPRGRRDYAEALLTVCEYLSGQAIPMPAVGARSTGRRFLERRLTMILKDTFPLRLRSFRLLAVGLIGVITLPAWSQKVPKDSHLDANGAGATGYVVEETIREGVTDRGEKRLIVIGEATIDPNADAPVLLDKSLPPMAQKVIEQYEEEKQTAHIELAQKIAKSRQEALGQLTLILRYLDKAGATEQSQAVRAAMEMLRKQAGPSGPRALPDPGTLSQYRDRVGQRFFFEVTGSASGRIWGSNIYTDDSALAVAAVHAGLLKDGQHGVLRVTILPGFDSYDGSSRNGVVSDPYEAWPGSYIVDAIPSAKPPLRLHSYEGPRSSIAPSVPGGPYLVDPSTWKRQPGPPSAGPSDAPGTTLIPTPGTTVNGEEVGAGHAVGDTFTVDVVGSTKGWVWGDKIYTTDSSLAAAAVHAGLLKEGEHGKVMVTVLPGQDAYEGATHNGVTSQSWNAFRRSFKVEGAVNAAPPLLPPGGTGPGENPPK